MEETAASKPTDLRDSLNVLRRRRYVILVTAFIAVALAIAYSVLTPPTYSATATVLVPQQQANSALDIQNSQLPAAASLQRTLADEQQFAKGDSVKSTAAGILGSPASVSVGSSTTDDVLSFTASSGDKQRAATVANAYARAYITARRANQVNQYTQQVTALEQSIASLQAKASALAPGDPQAAALQQSVTTLTQSVEQAQAASQVANQVGPSILKAALVPSKPASPNPVRDGILALLVGLILGVAFAFLIERLDDGIRSREVAERAAGGLPVVALVPSVAAWRGKSEHHLALIEDPASVPSEAYRTLRTSVQFLSIDDPKRVVGLTSSLPGEGKTTTVANLAVSFAKAGQRVIVVSCDLRRPRLHEFFDAPNTVGLTSVLLGRATLDEALIPVAAEPSLQILPSGPVPPNPAEILSSDRVREVIDNLSNRCDVVLLDCPPVLPITDALLISRLVDGILLVASTESTSTRDLARTAELLRQVDAPLMGTILNRVPTSGSRSYAYYGYGYGSYSSYSADVSPTSPAVPLHVPDTNHNSGDNGAEATAPASAFPAASTASVVYGAQVPVVTPPPPPPADGLDPSRPAAATSDSDPAHYESSSLGSAPSQVLSTNSPSHGSPLDSDASPAADSPTFQITPAGPSRPFDFPNGNGGPEWENRRPTDHQ